MMDALDTAVIAAMREAGEKAILARYRSLAKGEIREKTPGDVVTVADHDSEAILTAALATIEPQAAIVGEEACSEDPSIAGRLSHDLCWIIDPLDGTNNFAAGKPPFGIIVALSQSGETERGWLLDPLTGRLCHARRSHGAFVDGEPVTARTTGECQPVAGISMLFTDAEKRAALQEHIAPHYRLVDIPRCAAEQYPRLALGQNDISLFERTLAWDHAAGVLWLNEAGGMAARPDGTPYRPDSTASGLIGAANPRLFEELSRRIDAMIVDTPPPHSSDN